MEFVHSIHVLQTRNETTEMQNVKTSYREARVCLCNSRETK